MSFEYTGVKVDKLKKLWPIITSNLSFGLDDYSNISTELENAADISNVQAIIRICCDHKPVTFDEYISYVMITTFMNLLKTTSTQLRLQSAQLMAHTFNADTKQWYRDEEKVLTAAEAIWNVSSDASNMNRMIIEIHHQNQFAFNVSMVLNIAVLGSLTASRAKSNQLPLVNSDAIFEQIGKLDIMKNQCDKKFLVDFLHLFQTFQRLVTSSAARDETLKNFLTIQPNQLDRLKNQLQAILQSLNKRITNDQRDLNENTTISHCIQLILHNMDLIDINLF